MRAHNELMLEVLLVLQSSITQADRQVVVRMAPATQSISHRVFVTTVGDDVLERLRSMAGVAAVLTGIEPGQTLPAMDESEALFVRAWLSSRGQAKVRPGDGLDWDTPPMLPPDPKR